MWSGLGFAKSGSRLLIGVLPMALRIKCACGKSLKVSSQLADKKLLCPGCKKAFRIPAEKFKTAAATPAQPVAVKKAAAPKPPTEAPVPAPVELDLLPDKIDWSSGDLSVSQSDIFTGLIPDAPPAPAAAAQSAGKPCPGCKQPVPAGAVLCVNCGLNLHTRTYMKASLPPGVVPVQSAATVSYATDGTISSGSRPGRVDMDAIAPPKRGFWADAFRAFAYPFISANNGIVFGMIVITDSLRVLIGSASWLVPCLIVTLAVFIGVVCIRGWIAAVMLSIIQDTAAGSDDLPGIKIQDGVMEDVIKPLLKYIGAGACALLPASIYLILMTGGALPNSFSSGLNVVLLIGAGIFVWPIILMLFAFDAENNIIRIDLIATTIFRTFVPYLCLWLMLMLASFGTIATLAAWLLLRAGTSVSLPQLPQIPGLAGALIYNIASLYLSIVSMRLIGLYYLHFKKRFTLVME